MKSISALGAVVALVLSGCDAITSHPSIPPEAQHILRDGVQVGKGLVRDVDQVVAGFRLKGEESAAVGQLTRAMFSVLDIQDTGGFVRTAIEIKRAQLCLATVGLEGSGVIEDLQRYLYRDERAARLWTQMQTYVASLELPSTDGVVCDHAKRTA